MITISINILIEVLVFLILGSAIGVVLSKGAVQSVLFLILTFFNTAILFFYFGIEYLAYVFIIVYVGAIAVLFLFVVMMLNLAVIEDSVQPSISFLVLSCCFIFFITGVSFIGVLTNGLNIIWAESLLMTMPWSELFFVKNDIEAVGESLFNKYWLEFLLCAIILLGAMLGTIGLTISSRSIKTDQANKKQELFDQISRKSHIFIKIGKRQLD